jgi:octaprenyl-diphosphate synthase
MLTAGTSALAGPAPIELHPETRLVWKQIVGTAEPFLQAVAARLSDQIRGFDADIAAYAEYALTNQGKQLRPALVALSGGATGKVNDSHVMVAAIIEMVHLATLVHDDVMDEAKIRRGRPTLAANWGNEISVLLGDCLFAHALTLAASFPTPEICRAVASATNTVCAGEILQTRRQGNLTLSQAEYFKML